MRDSSINQSLNRGFLLLGIVAAEPLRLSQIAERAGLAKSTTSRLLGSLGRLGAVRLDGDRYLIGPAISSLAVGAADGREILRGLAALVLSRLSDDVGESTVIAVMEGSDTYYLSQVSGPSPVQAGEWADERHPPHASAFGLVLMADWSAERVRAYTANDLEVFTTSTVVDPVHVRSRCQSIAEAGVAWTIGEYLDEVASCAAPVSNSSGEVVASIGCFAPSYRFPGSADWEEIEVQVKAAASELSTLLASPS